LRAGRVAAPGWREGDRERRSCGIVACAPRPRRRRSAPERGGRRSPRCKIEVVPTKPTVTQRDLSLAYTPGVAEPCKEIEADPELAYEYTARGNLVAVVSNGTAVLGLGNIGAPPASPSWRARACSSSASPTSTSSTSRSTARTREEIIRACQLLEPTFGGINLEDIKAPECFEIERNSCAP
jgi:malate dehydrogenase (oxaloacetate-decarboxylating)(NADP+)